MEICKQRACFQAVDDHITSSTRVVGIGSGSTIPFVITRILEKSHHIIAFIPTSFQSAKLITSAGLPISDLNTHPVIDVTFDGADEISPHLTCIKGGGACHFQEKLVASASKKFVVVADFRKQSPGLNISWKKGVPVEVFPWAFSSKLEKFGKPVLRMAIEKQGPCISDHGNFIVDVQCKEWHNDEEIRDFEVNVGMISGVIETGIFREMVGWAYIGTLEGVTKLESISNQKKQLEAVS